MKQPDEAEAAASISFDDTPLARELADLSARRRALESTDVRLSGRTRVLTVSNQKGGVGKTTTAVNIAASMASVGARVLVIDLDPQGNASTALGVPHTADIPSVYDVLIDDFPLADIVQTSPESPNLLCAPSTIHLAGAEIELVSQVAREHRLRTALDDYLAGLDERLDFVLIDCPPSLGLLTINAFTAASELLIPIQCEYYALEGLSQLLGTVRMIQKHLNPTLRLSTILLTMYDGRTRLAQQVAEEVREHFPKEVLTTVVPRSVRVSEAPSFGQTVIAYDGQSAGAIAYREAAIEIIQRDNAPENERSVLMAAKRTGLGRGIGALIPTSEATDDRPADVFFPRQAVAEDEALTIPVPIHRGAHRRAGCAAREHRPALIVPNPRQPRTHFDPDDLAELVHSVREFGVLQPVVVRATDEGTYELIMGERRTRAAREAGLDSIPAVIRDTADEHLLRDALLENLHRSELNPLEEASAYQQLLEDFGITQEELATRIGRSRPQISNTIRLLKLPIPVQQRVAAGVLSAGHARAILSLGDDPRGHAAPGRQDRQRGSLGSRRGGGGEGSGCRRASAHRNRRPAHAARTSTRSPNGSAIDSTRASGCH